MERGDLISINLQGREVLFCIVGMYQDREDGKDILVMALIDPLQIVHVKSDVLGLKSPGQCVTH